MGNTTTAAACNGKNYGVYVDYLEGDSPNGFTMSGSPRITQDNVVALASATIILDGILDCPDAIDVVFDEYDAIDDFYEGERILRARDPAYITENAEKFLFYGMPNCIRLEEGGFDIYSGGYTGVYTGEYSADE